MTTKREFIEAYCMAAVSGAASTRSQLKPHDLVADAIDLWNALESGEQDAAEMNAKRGKSKAPPRPVLPPVEP
jgi:hypothetical protein